MRILKFKVKAKNKILITFEKVNKVTRVWDEFSMSCSEDPRPELVLNLQNLAPNVVEMCELPENYIKKIKVTGVSFSYGGDKEVMGATIISQMTLNNSNCALNLNTPHKASSPYSDGPADENQLLTDDCVENLYKLCKEIKLYIDGERAQTRLFALK